VNPARSFALADVRAIVRMIQRVARRGARDASAGRKIPGIECIPSPSR
jgi:hypothetical protein